MVELLGNNYRRELLWLLALGEEGFYKLSLERRKRIFKMISSIYWHLLINKATVFELAKFLGVDENQMHDMFTIIILYGDLEGDIVGIIRVNTGGRWYKFGNL